MNNTGDTKKKTPMTEQERLQQWGRKLGEFGYSADAQKAIIELANRTVGYEIGQNGKARPYGGQLISMFGRLARRLRDESSEFSETDMEAAVQQLFVFLSRKPLGDNVDAWRAFGSNKAQLDELNKFFGLQRDPEFSGDPCEATLAYVRDAAWPSKLEEQKALGGSFAERFFIFARTIARLTTATDESTNMIFGEFYHEHTTRYPSWVKDGKCGDCGGDLATDSAGNVICSNPLCDHNVSQHVTKDLTSFERVYQPRKRFDAPKAEKGRRDNGDHRHRDYSDGEMPEEGHVFKKSKKNKWRENTSDVLTPTEDTPTVPNGTGDHVVASAGGDSSSFGSLAGAFDGLNIGDMPTANTSVDPSADPQ